MLNIHELTISQEYTNNPAKVKSGANAGIAEYQYALGIMYLKGEGVFRDCDKAAYWIKEAAKNDHAKANSIANDVEEFAAQVTAASTSSVSTTQANSIQKGTSIVDEEGIHWDVNNTEKLNMNYYENIGTINKVVGWGAILSAVFVIISVFVSFFNDGGVSALITFCTTIPLCLIGIMGANGLEKRKPYSVFLCLAYAWICTISNILDIVLNVASGNFPNIFTLIWAVYGATAIYMLYKSEDIKNAFPKTYQYTFPLVKGLVYAYIVIMALIFSLGLIAIFA